MNKSLTNILTIPACLALLPIHHFDVLKERAKTPLRKIHLTLYCILMLLPLLTGIYFTVAMFHDGYVRYRGSNIPKYSYIHNHKTDKLEATPFDEIKTRLYSGNYSLFFDETYYYFKGYDTSATGDYITSNENLNAIRFLDHDQIVRYDIHQRVWIRDRWSAVGFFLLSCLPVTILVIFALWIDWVFKKESKQTQSNHDVSPVEKAS